MGEVEEAVNGDHLLRCFSVKGSREEWMLEGDLELRRVRSYRVLNRLLRIIK